jgi:hypothetical protein
VKDAVSGGARTGCHGNAKKSARRKSMKMPSIRLTLGVVMLSVVMMACIQRPVHPTKNEREWTIDHQACERSVRESIREDPDTYDNFDEMRLIRRCMQKKGWHWERTSLFDFNRGPENEGAGKP